MNELKNILEQNLNDNFISAVLSNPRDEKLAAKVKVRPVLMKDKSLSDGDISWESGIS